MSNDYYWIFSEGNREYYIIPDYPEVGFYLFVIEDGKDIADQLQDNEMTVKVFALEDFNIPLDFWIYKKGIPQSFL